MSAIWQDLLVSRRDRERLGGHRACTVWFTGLPGAGKSTLANLLDKTLLERGIRTYVLDADNLRHGLNRDLGFTPDNRAENVRRIGEVARLFNDAGLIVATAVISPYRSDRDLVRHSMAAGDFVEVFVQAPVDVCERRDPKGLYKRARAGTLRDLTGISAPYEVPIRPEVTVHTDAAAPDQCVAQVLHYLEAQVYIAPVRVGDAAGAVR